MADARGRKQLPLVCDGPTQFPVCAVAMESRLMEPQSLGVRLGSGIGIAVVLHRPRWKASAGASLAEVKQRPTLFARFRTHYGIEPAVVQRD